MSEEMRFDPETVKRFDRQDAAEMFECFDGDWCRYETYDQLLTLYCTLLAKQEEIECVLENEGDFDNDDWSHDIEMGSR